MDELIEDDILLDDFAVFAANCKHCNKFASCTHQKALPECDIDNCKHPEWLKMVVR